MDNYINYIDPYIGYKFSIKTSVYHNGTFIVNQYRHITVIAISLKDAKETALRHCKPEKLVIVSPKLWVYTTEESLFSVSTLGKMIFRSVIDFEEDENNPDTHKKLLALG